MTKKQDAKDLENTAIALVCAVLFLPFAIGAWSAYSSLKGELLSGERAVRIFDLGRVFERLAYGLACVFGIAVICGVVIYGASHLINFIGYAEPMKIYATIGLAGFIVAFYVAYLAGEAAAVAYIGVVVDHERGFLAFPPDGVLRKLTSVNDIAEWLLPRQTQILDLVEIKRVTRQAGHTALLHTTLGSFAITFSDKLRRDQLISALNEGPEWDAELAGADDYA